MNKLTVIEIEQITPGARHVWIKTKELGRIRKPIGEFKPEQFDFSQMDEKIVLVERRLQHWGRWLLKNLTNGLGYPSQATVVTAMQGSPATAHAPLPDDPEAEEVNDGIKKLEADKKFWADVLKQHYTRDLDKTADDVAKSMELPDRTYRYYLNMGRKYVEKYLKTR
jgi:hypothetical protein